MGPAIMPGSELRCPLPFSPFSMDDVAPWKGSLADGRTLRLSGQDSTTVGLPCLAAGRMARAGKMEIPVEEVTREVEEVTREKVFRGLLASESCSDGERYQRLHQPRN